MNIKKVMLFAYDFPHKKTQDFIFRLLVEGYEISYIIAAPWKKLSIPKSEVRTCPKYSGLMHPKAIAKAFGIPYTVADHNSPKCINHLQQNPTDLYIISGARILSKKTIAAANNKVLNIHPGLLPEVRGLDTLLWSIEKNIPIGISSHLITHKIDSGKLIKKEKLILHNSDTIIDVSQRLLEEQSQALIDAIEALQDSETELQELPPAPYYTKMPGETEHKALEKFKTWLNKHSE